MGKIAIKVDWTDNYAAAPANEAIACVSTGRTLEEVQHNIIEALKFHIEGMLEDGDLIPVEFSGEWEFEWIFSTRALLHYTEGLVSRTAIAKATGINLQQLSHYATGYRHPRPDMKKRIIEGIHKIGKDLLTIS